MNSSPTYRQNHPVVGSADSNVNPSANVPEVIPTGFVNKEPANLAGLAANGSGKPSLRRQTLITKRYNPMSEEKKLEGVPEKLESPETGPSEAEMQEKAKEAAAKAQADQGGQNGAHCHHRPRTAAPLAKQYNLNIEETKQLFDVLAVSLNQSLYFLMKDTNVATLRMSEKINPEVPGSERWLEVLDTIKALPLDQAIESLNGSPRRLTRRSRTKTRPATLRTWKLDF